MRRLIVAIFVLMATIAAAHVASAQCIPPNSPFGSIGCEPLATNPSTSDYLQAWQPGQFPASATILSISKLGQILGVGGAPGGGTGAYQYNNSGTFGGVTSGANTLFGALFSNMPAALAVPSCSGTDQALNWTSGGGFGCVTITSGGTPGGASGAFQYNNAGTFGGITAPGNTLLGALALNTPTTIPVPSCFGGSNALNFQLGVGFSCLTISGGSATSITIASTTIGSGVANGILYTSSGLVLANASTVDNGVIVTGSGGIPAGSTTLPNGLAMGTPASLTLTNATGLPPAGLTIITPNAVLGNVGAGNAALALPSCPGASSALIFTTASGFGCNTLVSSVGLSLPSIFTVSGSPVTSTGTLTGTLASQTANLVFASPNGSSGAPAFRTLVAADLPSVALLNVANTWTAKQTMAASTTSGAGFNLPQGTAPTAPSNGDVWTTAAGLFVQIAGSTVGPLGTGSGGSGCTVSGGAQFQILVNNGSSGCSSSTYGSVNVGALTLGASGVLGSVTMGNATTGTVALEPVTGALGTVTALLPANSGTVAETNLAQTFSGTQTFSSGVTMSALSTGTIVSGGYIGLNASNQLVLSPAGGVTSVALSTPNNTLSLSGTNPITSSGTIDADINLAHANTWTAKQTMTASTTSTAYFNIAPGVAPTSPANGDIWATSSGVFAQVAGSTVGPFGATLTPIAANTLLANPTGSSALPEAVSLGVGLSFVGTVLVPQWAAGAVTAIGANCSITSGTFNCATGTTITLAPGFASIVGTQNTGSQTISNGSTLNQQNWSEVITTTPYTVSYPTDTGATLLSNATGGGPVAYTLRNPSSGTEGSVSPVFADQSGNGFSLTTVGGTATFYGFVGGGVATVTFSPYSLVQCTDDGANYFCLVSQGYSQLAIGQTAVNLGTNGRILFNNAGTLGNEASTAITFNAGTISLGGNLTTSAGLTTTGTGSPTFGFPTSSYTYTFPSVSAGLASLGNVNQTFAGSTTFTNSVVFATINSYLASVHSSAATSCTLATDNTGCSGAASGDCGVLMRFTSNSAVTVTEPSTYPSGCEVALEQDGTGKVSVVQGAGAILRANPHGYTGTYGQYAIIGVVGLSGGTAVMTGDGS